MSKRNKATLLLFWNHEPVRKFPSGQIVATFQALDAMTRASDDPREFLRRHFAGDWGDLCKEDFQSNEAALRDGERVLSSYRTSLDEKLWIITEADRSATTILLPSDY